MSAFAEVRQLLLDTRDIGWFNAARPIQTTYYNADYVNPNLGKVNNRLTDAEWRVDLEALLGPEMWASYDKFNIGIRSFTINTLQI